MIHPAETGKLNRHIIVVVLHDVGRRIHVVIVQRLLNEIASGQSL